MARWIVLIILTGCAAAPPPPSAPTVPTLVVPALTPAAPEAEPIVDLPTLVTTHTDDLLGFLDRATSPSGVPAMSRGELAEPRPSISDRVTGMRIRTGPWTCFVRRTKNDDRAAVMRSSPEGFLVVPLAWIAEVLVLPGAREDDLRAFYIALQRQLARTGHASGLARFDNGNAMTLSLGLRDLGPVDVELYADSRFLRAGTFDANASPLVIDGADRVQTRAKNHHRGVSVHDLLRDLRTDKSIEPQST